MLVKYFEGCARFKDACGLEAVTGRAPLHWGLAADVEAEAQSIKKKDQLSGKFSRPIHTGITIRSIDYTLLLISLSLCGLPIYISV